MLKKRLFDIFASLFGLLLIWWVYPIVVLLIKVKMPGGSAFFCQKRVGKDGKLFTCHKFRSMTVKHSGSSVSVAGDSRITPFGAKLRHYKIDELPELWDVLIGTMSFVGPRPDVPGYADQLQGDDRVVLKLRPGITGPATLKYRLEDEMIASFVDNVRKGLVSQDMVLPSSYQQLSDQELAVWYNDNVIYPDKVRLNKYYYEHYSFIKDIEMIFATVLGFKVKFNGELI
ncbi:sugar transferase [Bacteroides sp. AM23-12]|uniref:sugar transferase n=1 Tax=Bacteroides sp. AM23-12 TaxID=2292942 RepID=UPI000E420221|nr:sugar transferase [Bacteroides sp. AM23-12]RGC86627.1 sugar transferase [Bacteroides sp. AM23-12]